MDPKEQELVEVESTDLLHLSQGMFSFIINPLRLNGLYHFAT